MVDTHTLLQHRDFVRALAIRLVSDPDAAEDAEQDAWLAAIRRPPNDESRVVPWLRSVVLNRVRSRYRSDSRRAAREHDVAVSEAIDSSPGDQARIADEVGRAVHSLKAAYRDVIVLRFYEGLSPREIGARLDMPVETVRTRLKRGLSELRSRLDHAYDGDRRRWALAMSPWIRTSNAGGLVAWITGVLAMGVVWKGLVSAVAIAAAWVFLGPTPPSPSVVDTPRDVEELASVEDPAAGEVKTASSLGRVEVVEEDRRVPRGPARSLGTRVFDLDTEEPIPFATAEVTRVRGSVEESMGVIVADSEGYLAFHRSRFANGVDWVGARLSDYALRIGMTGYRSEVVLSGSDPMESPLPEEVYLERGGTVRGRLLDGDGFAAPRGEIEFTLVGERRVEIREVDVGPSGIYSFVAPEAGRFRVEVVHLGVGRGASAELDVDPKRDQTIPDIALTGPGELVGRVVDLAWQPVSGVTVDAYSAEPRFDGVGTQHGQVVSGPDGAFRFRGLAGDRYEITTSEDQVNELVDVTPGGPPVLLQINEPRLSIEVYSAVGTPVPGARVRAEWQPVDEEDEGWSEQWEVTQSDGRIDLFLAPGRYSLQGFSEGAVSDIQRVAIEEGKPAGRVPLTLKRVGVGGLDVELVTRQGRAVPILDLRVSEMRALDPAEWYVEGDGARKLRLEGLSAGRYRVVARPEVSEWNGEVFHFQSVYLEVEVGEDQITEVRRVVRQGGMVLIQVMGIPSTPGGMGRLDPGVRWFPPPGVDGMLDEKSAINLRGFIPVVPQPPGQPPLPVENWSFTDVLPIGPGVLTIPTGAGMQSVEIELRPNQVTLATVQWYG